MAANGSSTTWHVAIIGGFKPRGTWLVKARTIVLTLLGGVSVDLRQAQFTSDDTEIINFSIIGGMDLAVPEGIQIDTGGFRVFDGTKRKGNFPSSPTDRIVRVRSYSIIGGFDIHN